MAHSPSKLTTTYVFIPEFTCRLPQTDEAGYQLFPSPDIGFSHRLPAHRVSQSSSSSVETLDRLPLLTPSSHMHDPSQ
ncbi:hypothetical protein PCANC_24156 [Puccinia coronata f. sp. avenae]|uniref:Uncharacterized protein n=1 Tax=Puccinia coronata f. sp. avenae TaxID=200324 RepID=A0A2N5TXZ9_9BASI|nr:hypothetical protein PCANC_24156 [Puccinia coronata f. sp. avenae]